MTNYNDGKWHGWNGGDCPVHPKTCIQVVFTDGVEISRLAECYTWCCGDDSEIIAFRVTKEHKEPREFWVLPESGRCFTNKPIAYTAIHVREVTE